MKVFFVILAILVPWTTNNQYLDAIVGLDTEGLFATSAVLTDTKLIYLKKK